MGRFKQGNNKGFTMAELLIVVAIIGVLVAISIPIFNGRLEKSRQSVDLSNMRSAKSAAVAEWLGSGASGTVEYKYDAGRGVVTTDYTPSGYGKSSTNVTAFDTVMEGASGVPNQDGTAHYITVKVDNNGDVTLRWGGNDLTTSAGRRQEDIDNMHSIKTAILKALDAKTLVPSADGCNYFQVAVFADGTMAYFFDKHGGNSEYEAKIKKALEDAGLNTDKTTLYSTDANWKYGYVVHVEKNGTVTYKAISESENENKTIQWNWWNKKNMTDEDL